MGASWKLNIMNIDPKNKLFLLEKWIIYIKYLFTKIKHNFLNDYKIF